MRVRSLYIPKAKVKCCHDGMTVQEAIDFLRETGYRCVPVLKGDVFLGLVYKIDAKEYIYEQNGSPEGPIQNIIIDTDAVVTENSSFVKALFTIKRLPFLAVVDEERRLKGILTHNAVMEVLEDALGVKTGGIHFTIAASHTKGSLYHITDILKHYNIEGLITLDNGTRLFRRIGVTIPLTTPPHDVETLSHLLEKKGYRVLDREIIQAKL
ncbi:MAG TPA: CBS domain-containing protein [Bacillus sp. (in: firmicutes)]|nr:CBS domain-containing protein [Bacillus sp. (in: firmicutes)]